ncbi:hypothetical protein [Spirosoma gilvum]
MTGQNYVVGGGNTTPTATNQPQNPSAAKIGPQSPTIPDSRQGQSALQQNGSTPLPIRPEFSPINADEHPSLNPIDSEAPKLTTVGPEQVQVNKSVYEAQTRLLELVDDFLRRGKGVTPIEAINELLFEWLSTPHTTLASTRDEAKLWIALELASFLSKLKQYADQADYRLEEAHQEGVLYGQ